MALQQIPKIRQIVRSLLKKCINCRKVQGKPYSAPEASSQERCVCAALFNVTGLDFTGALLVRSMKGEQNVHMLVYLCQYKGSTFRSSHRLNRNKFLAGVQKVYWLEVLLMVQRKNLSGARRSLVSPQRMLRADVI